MGQRSSGSNLVTKGIARLVADVGSEVVDVFLDLATRVGSRYTKDGAAPVPRPAEWWNARDPKSQSRSPASARSGR